MNDGFSTPNCEICKDYPKEYWCGNPKNKISTPDEEIIKSFVDITKEPVIKEIIYMENEMGLSFDREEMNELLHNLRNEALSLKEQEVSEKVQDAFEDDELINHWIEHKLNEKLSSLKEKIEKSMNELNSDLVCIDFKRDLTKEDYQIITAFFDKINIARIKLGLEAIEHIDDEEELQKIFQEIGK
jgi:hypothetical protein